VPTPGHCEPRARRFGTTSRGREPGGFSKNTPVPLVATAHYILDLRHVARAAAMTGRPADAARYGALADSVAKRFNEVFFHPDSCYYGTNSQCSNALPLFLGLAGSHEKEVLRHLTNDIKSHGNRLTTGDVGNRYLFRVLTDNGLDSLLYLMLDHDDAPGYGYQIRAGATTLTEQWIPENGSSQNHFMMGQADEWFFRSLAGLRQQPGTRGMRHLLIAPRLPGDLQWVEASTAAAGGIVSVRATRSQVTVTIPEGCDAIVVKPDGSEHRTGPGCHTF